MTRLLNHSMLIALVLCGGVLFWPYLAATMTLLVESSPYLLIGFWLAGVLRAAIPEDKVYRHLGEQRLKSVALASLFGIPLPLCSCSVLPVATSLRQSGASKGATTSFLISTPETGLDSIGITYALLDPLMTVARPLAAFATAVATGALVNGLERRGWDDRNDNDEHHERRQDNHPHHDHSAVWSTGTRGKGVADVVQEATTYAFGPLMDDLTPWFIIGFLISGVIAVAIPEGFFGEVVAVGWASSVLMLLIGTPMYICAAAATPVAATLIAKGLDPGAALVLLLVGPATNATTMIVIARLLGKRVLALHLVGVTGGALLLGVSLNFIYAQLGIDLSAVAAAVVVRGMAPVNMMATVLLLFLLVKSAARIHLLPQWGQRLSALAAPLGWEPFSTRSRVVILIVAVLAYLSTAFSAIGPGETGWVVRFGRVIRTHAEPGLIAHLPKPFESVTRLRTHEVRSVDLGFDRQAVTSAAPLVWPVLTGDVEVSRGGSMRRDLADAAEVMTGEENLLSVTYAVHFDVHDPYAYRYRVAEPVKVVRAFAGWALRKAVARRASSEVLITHRRAIEEEALAILQAELDALGSGVRVLTVTLQDVHASPEVHDAFRDVASALEDKERLTRQAEGYQSATLASSRAEAFALTQEAQSYQSETINAAAGEARAFQNRWQSYRRQPELTRLRLFFQTVEETLGDAKTIFLLGDDVDVELWQTPRQGTVEGWPGQPSTVRPLPPSP